MLTIPVTHPVTGTVCREKGAMTCARSHKRRLLPSYGVVALQSNRLLKTDRLAIARTREIADRIEVGSNGLNKLAEMLEAFTRGLGDSMRRKACDLGGSYRALKQMCASGQRFKRVQGCSAVCLSSFGFVSGKMLPWHYVACPSGLKDVACQNLQGKARPDSCLVLYWY